MHVKNYREIREACLTSAYRNLDQEGGEVSQRATLLIKQLHISAQLLITNAVEGIIKSFVSQYSAKRNH